MGYFAKGIDSALRGSFESKRVFLTGANGVLGVEVAAQLLASGASLVAITRNPELFRRRLTVVGAPRLDSVVTYPLDLTRRVDLLEQALETTEPDFVIHLAAQAIVSQAERSPQSTFDTNCTATFALFEAVKALPHHPVVVVSISDKAYGAAPTPYREDGPLLGGQCGGVYELSKVVQDSIAGHFGQYFPVVRMRCCNLIGADINLSRIVPATFQRVLLGQSARLHEGAEGMVRTYVDARDAARAFLLAAQRGRAAGVAGEAFNVGNPRCVLSTRQVIEQVLAVIGVPPDRIEVVKRPRHFPSRVEIAEQTLDISKARRLLDWAPEVSFEASVRRAWEAHRALFAPAMAARSGGAHPVSAGLGVLSCQAP